MSLMSIDHANTMKKKRKRKKKKCLFYISSAMFKTMQRNYGDDGAEDRCVGQTK